MGQMCFALLTLLVRFAIVAKLFALVAQLVEHIVGNDEVSGPIPLWSWIFCLGENHGEQKEDCG